MRALILAAVAAICGCAYDRPAFVTPDDAGDAPDDAEPDAVPSCVADSECASQICDLGECVPADLVRYVAVTGTDSAPCSQAMPCATIARARQTTVSTQAYVVVGAGAYPAQVRVANGRLTIVGTGAVAPRINVQSGAAIDVSGGTVALRHVQLTSSAPTATAGLSCISATVALADVILRGSTGAGLDSKDCDVEVRASKVTSNAGAGLHAADGALRVYSSVLHANALGGAVVSTASSCAIVGSVIDGNGSASSPSGGAVLSCTGGIRVENVTFVDNLTGNAAANDLICSGLAQSLVVRNEIFVGASPFLAGCAATYSMFQGPQAPPTGTGNRAIVSAGFVDPTADFHLAPDSVARGAADPETTVERDLDGELRPIGAWDVGADEVP